MTAVPELVRRVSAPPAGAPAASPLTLALTAEERTRLRGRRQTLCGLELLLQLPRTEPLEPGEWLTTAGEDLWVQVEAAPEPLLLVRSPDPLALLQAAYHLGNRHVALELALDGLRLLADPVLEALLRHRGLELDTIVAPFRPEAGAYGGHQGGHHGHHHHGA